MLGNTFLELPKTNEKLVKLHYVAYNVSLVTNIIYVLARVHVGVASLSGNQKETISVRRHAPRSVQTVHARRVLEHELSLWVQNYNSTATVIRHENVIKMVTAQSPG